MTSKKRRRLPALLTIQQVAEFAGVTVQWVYREINEGNLKAERVGGTVLVVTRENYKAWEKERR